MAAEPVPEREFNLRKLAAPIYLPTVLFGIGEGATAPVLVLSARELGASVGTAGIIVALSAVGKVCGALPAGVIAARFGERRTMLGAAALAAVTMTGCAVSTRLWMLAPAVFCLGLSEAVFGLARHSYLATAVPFNFRARAMSLLGGSNRIGLFIGPFAAFGAMGAGGLSAAYWVHVAAAVATGATVLAIGELPGEARESGGRKGGANVAKEPPVRLGAVLRDNARVLCTLGSAAVLMGAVRAGRQVAVPLWAQHIGLDAQDTSLVFGLSGAVEMLLFYPAGKVMDRYGRAWIAIPCLLILGGMHLLLPLTASFGTLLAVSMAMGFGNGIGSGIIMTLGADVSPEQGRAQFLGAWRLASDVGTAGGPLLISALTTAFTLAVGLGAMGALGFAGAAAMARWIPRYSRRPGDRVD